MRLTNDSRDAFVRAVMDDVPYVDYYSQAAKLVQDYQLRRLPREIRAVYEQPELRGYLKAEVCYYFRRFRSIAAVGTAPLDEETQRKLADLEDKDHEQDKRRSELRQKLRAAVAAVKTRKQLIEALPEFAKYAPPETESPSRAVPVLTDVVTDFVAAGWPKSRVTAESKSATKRATKRASK
jgi:hypothetical protein